VKRVMIPWFAAGLKHPSPRALSCVGGLASDGRLDRVERGDASQCFGRDGGAGCLMHLVEFAPRMGPACRQLDIAAGTQPLEPGVTVDLNDSSELRERPGRSSRLQRPAVRLDRPASPVCTC
jgi:hypothetical protein